jgi:hypothetical protein
MTLTPLRRLAVLAASALTLTACGEDSSSRADAEPSDRETIEVTRHLPRVVVATETGITTMDASTGTVLGEEELRGFKRLSPVGDGRHLGVAIGDGFTLFDTGLIEKAHGDHSHLYETDPSLTDVEYAAPEPGHLVHHHGVAALFSDGEGTAQVVPVEDVATGAEGRTVAADAPHHGVAVPLADGQLLITEGTADARRTVRVVDAQDKEVARTDTCVGVHGEAVAAPQGGAETVVMGCENGPEVYRDGTFTKVEIEEDYARTGNLAGSEESPIVLADYKTDPDAEHERPEQVALIDTRDNTLTKVPLEASYWFRSLARGPEGEGLVLTTDGNLTVIDQESGRVTAQIPVIEEWTEADEWQQPGPLVKVAGDRAYVSEPAAGKVHVVDLRDQQVTTSLDAPEGVIEMEVVSGAA